MFIQTETYIYEADWISFGDNVIKFIAKHDNDERTIPINTVLTVSKIHPNA